MSDPNNLPLDPEAWNAAVNDAFKDSGFAGRKGPKPPTPNEQVIHRAGKVTENVMALLRQILKADADKGGRYDRDAAFATAFKFTEDHFRTWSKDDLLFIVTTVHAEFLLGKADDYAEVVYPTRLPPV